MSLDFQDVRRIAKLARVAVSEQDVHMYQHRINGVLALVAQMQAIDTQGVAPMAHAATFREHHEAVGKRMEEGGASKVGQFLREQELAQPLREDVVTETDQHEKFQAIAPQVAGGLYLVPQVIEHDD